MANVETVHADQLLALSTTMASTNPFDEEKESSTNPFDEKAAPRSPDSTNPFDDDNDDDPIDDTAKSTNPFDINGEINNDRIGSTNPFEDADERKADNTVSSDDASQTSSLLQREKPSTNPFDNDENDVVGSKESINPFEVNSEKPPKTSLPSDTTRPSEAAISPITPATVIQSVALPEKLKPSASQAGTPRSSATKVCASTPETPTFSVTKILTQLLSVPTNRSCADCRSPLIDSSQVHASFSTSLGQLPTPPSSPESSSLGSFQFHHAAFAPPTAVPTRPSHSVLPRKPKQTIDPAVAVTHYTGGHGVFLCSACGMAHHSALGSTFATVRYVQGANASWSIEQVQFMAQAGGNARSWRVYEAYMPESWQRRRPTSKSTMAERELFCRAKYEALAFVTPIGGPLAESAWLKLVKDNEAVEIWDKSEEFHEFGKLTVQSGAVTAPKTGNVQLPSRLVDFFCVVGHNGQLTAGSATSLSNITSIEQLSLDTCVVDCYPSPDAYADMEFPEHIAKFVFPDGCQPKETKMAPTFFGFVLTDSSGLRLYGAALHVYDESMDTEVLMDTIITADNDSSNAPAALQSPPEIVFLPKSLVVFSHYPFSNLWRHFLLLLYRVTLVEAPLPIERYIANFVSEVPLPPQGKIRVKYGLTEEGICAISRPAVNQLPLADFSYVPLFASLSVENIMVVTGCLLEESQVTLVSRHSSMLTPVAEALLSLLFPFEWEGIYVPVMPFSMLDVLDAPIPFLVGIHSRYLSVTKPSNRPRGVIFVDLDEDILHLGFDPETSAPRQAPSLPEKDALKLKAKLQKYGSIVYMSALQDNTGKARMTTGNGTNLSNNEREPYAQPSSFYGAAPLSTRLVALARTEKAYDDLLTPISGFLSESGQLSGRESQTVPTPKKKGLFKKKNLLSKSIPSSKSDTPATKRVACLLDDQGPDGFSTFEIRNAWLRFFVSLFRNYDDFLLRGKRQQREMFRREAFLDYLDLTPSSRLFMAKVLSTQMFQSFLEERISNPDDPAVRFFDESIVAKNNRSKVTTLTAGGKKETPFLDSKSGEVLDTFTPPPPSNLGLPDDGKGYLYGSFPKLDSHLFGKVRPPKQWPQDTKVPKHSTAFLSKQKEIFAKAMKPLTPVSNLAKSVTKDVEWAVRALSCRDLPKQILFQQPRERRKLTPSKQNGIAKAPSVRINELPAAQELVLSARRKQGVLIEISIRIQALCRMYIAKSRYKKLRAATICLQRRYRRFPHEKQRNDLGRTRRSAVSIQRIARGLVARRRARTTRSAVSIQRITRGFVARRRVTILLESVLLLQRWVRGAMVRLYWKQITKAAVMAQSIIRRRRVGFAYRLLKRLLCKLQALVRGWLVRKRLEKLLQKLTTLYRTQMANLWQRSHAPLSYRTKFWSSTEPEGFLYFRLTEEELERLWKTLGVTFNPPAANNGIDGVNELSIPIDDRTYRRFLMVQGTLSANSQEGESSSAFLPAEVSESDLHVHLEQASERLQIEKLQIYEKLNLCKDKNRLDKWYGALGISCREKGKKSRLLSIIWSSHEYADSSTSVMISLFPELETSNDIHCAKVSKKGHRRLHTGSDEMKPLDKSFLIQTKIVNRIKSNMREFATARLNMLQLQDQPPSERFDRQQKAAMEARGYENWHCCRYEIISSLLKPEHTTTK